MSVEVQTRPTDLYLARQLSCHPYAFMSAVYASDSEATARTVLSENPNANPTLQEEPPSQTLSEADPSIDASKSYILTLPYELRQEIYSHLLTLTTPTSTTLYPQILSTCTQIHDEALPLLYKSNTFTAHPSLLASFPRLTPTSPPIASSRHAALVTHLKVLIRLDAGAAFTNSRATRELSSLEELTVECRQSAYGVAGPQALRLFEGVRGVRRARVVGSTTGFDEYAKWLEGIMMRPRGDEAEDYRPPRDQHHASELEQEGEGESRWYFGPLGRNVRWDGCNFVM